MCWTDKERSGAAHQSPPGGELEYMAGCSLLDRLGKYWGVVRLGNFQVSTLITSLGPITVETWVVTGGRLWWSKLSRRPLRLGWPKDWQVSGGEKGYLLQLQKNIKMLLQLKIHYWIYLPIMQFILKLKSTSPTSVLQNKRGDDAVPLCVDRKSVV